MVPLLLVRTADRIYPSLELPNFSGRTSKGLPFKPVGATIEDSASVCAWVVDSVNAAETRADSNYQNVSAGYIVRVGDSKVFTTDHPFPVSSFLIFTSQGQPVVEVLFLQ